MTANRTPEKQPPVYPVKEVAIPGVSQAVLDNGIPVYLLGSGEEEIMRMEIIFNAGQVRETAPLVASTTALMLTEGSKKRTSEELNRLLDFHGIFLNVLPEKDLSGIVFFFLNKHTETALELAAEIIFGPVFPEAELNALMKKRLNWFLVNREKVSNMANDHFFEAAFGKKHPYGRQVSEKDFLSIDRSTVSSFHDSFYRPGNMSVIISGKLHDRIIPLLGKYLGSYGNDGRSYGTNGIKPGGEAVKQICLAKTGAVQTAVRIGSATINKKEPDYLGLKVLNTILGGYFGSRLMQNIREDKGYTYGISSNLTSLGQTGYKLISAEVNSQYTGAAIEEILKEISRLQTTPVEEAELTLVKNYMSGEMVRMFDGPFASAETFRAALEFGLDFEYYRKMAQKIKNITPEEIISLARTYYNIDDLYIVTAGPGS